MTKSVDKNAKALKNWKTFKKAETGLMNAQKRHNKALMSVMKDNRPTMRYLFIIALFLLAIPLAIYIYIIYAQVLSVLLIQKQLKNDSLDSKAKSNLKKVYASNVMVLILSGTSTITFGLLFIVLLILLFML